MKLTVYLSRDIFDILNCYGSLNDVTNKILAAGAAGEFDLLDRPAVPPRVNGSYHTINVTNQYYINLTNLYGTTSSKVSLRRILYWFVNNDMFEQLEWTPTTIMPTKFEKAEDAINKIRLDLSELCKYTDDKKCINNIRKNLNEIEESICDG